MPKVVGGSWKQLFFDFQIANVDWPQLWSVECIKNLDSVKSKH